MDIAPDCRTLNDSTIKGKNQMPSADVLIEMGGEIAKVVNSEQVRYSKLHLNSPYGQRKLHPIIAKHCVFSVSGFWQFDRGFYGFTNFHVDFQNTMSLKIEIVPEAHFNMHGRINQGSCICNIKQP